jgi:hypothetical protein
MLLVGPQAFIEIFSTSSYKKVSHLIFVKFLRIGYCFHQNVNMFPIIHDWQRRWNEKPNQKVL